MGRILAIDYGTKRTGIAVTDALQMIAFGLSTVKTSALFSFLKAYTSSETVTLFVVGVPKQMNNQASASAPFVDMFIKQLKAEFSSIPIHRIDERFTSKIAFQSMVASGLKKKQRSNKALIDEVSATIILQSYLSYREQVL